METTDTITPTATTNGSIAAWGDSFTAGAGGAPYPLILTQLSGSPVFNGGVGGETSVQIKDRMVAATDKHAWPTIIWAGRNDSDRPTQVKSSIAAMVAALSHPHYLVLSVMNGAGEGRGTHGYQVVMTLNNDLAALYGNHYLDVRAHLVAQYNPALTQDVTDHEADVPPNSLRSDFLHLSTAGSALVANHIRANGASLFGPNQPIGATAPSVLSDLSVLGKVTQTATNDTDNLTEWHATNGNVVALEKDGNALSASASLYLNGGVNTVLQAARATAIEITPNSVYVKQRIVQESGDLEFGTSINGVILKAPNGTRYRSTVTNEGTLKTTVVV